MFFLTPEPISDASTPEGTLLHDLEEKEAALAAYEQAIQLTPSEPSFHDHKGHVLEQLGRLSEAQRAFEEAQRLRYKN